MAISQEFVNQRLSLTASQKTGVTPPRPCRTVEILALSTGDLQVHSTDDDNSHYVTISAGAGWTFPLNQAVFDPTRISFWLTATSTGTAGLIWS